MSLKYLLTNHEVFILNPTAFRILCTTPRNFRAAKSSKARLMHRQSNTLVTYNQKNSDVCRCLIVKLVVLLIKLLSRNVSMSALPCFLARYYVRTPTILILNLRSDQSLQTCSDFYSKSWFLNKIWWLIISLFSFSNNLFNFSCLIKTLLRKKAIYHIFIVRCVSQKF